MLGYAPRLKANARALRGNLTEAEEKLWYRLRRKQINGWQFYRQKPLGPYIVDFYCPAARLVVELDGGQHFEPEHQAADHKRDAQLAGLGLRVLRFDNRQALQETEAVVAMIAAVAIPPNPPFSKGGATPQPNPSATPTASIPPFEKGGLGGIYTASTEDEA
jgi:very-short-patch-repair endonuclease